MSVTEADDFLADAGGSQFPSFKFNTVGDTLVGRIVDRPRVVELKSKFSGEMERKLVVNIEQDDGDTFTLWVKGGRLASAIKAACTEAGAEGLRKGGRLGVAYTEDIPTDKGNPAKGYRAKYEPPAQEEKPPVAVDDLF